LGSQSGALADARIDGYGLSLWLAAVAGGYGCGWRLWLWLVSVACGWDKWRGDRVRRMRFWGAITRGVGVLVRAGPLTRALCPKARSPNPITAPETLLGRQAGERQK